LVDSRWSMVDGSVDSDVYIDWMVRSTPAAVLTWINETDLRSELRKDFERTWADRVESGDWVIGFARACPVEGARPDDYRLRELSVSSAATVLAGIHFRNRQVAHPFVGVYAQSRELTADEICEASSKLLAEFDLFNPEFVRWWSPEQSDLRTLPRATGDRRLVAGRIADAVDRPLPTLPTGMSLEPDSGLSCYGDYEQMFADVVRRNPNRQDRLSLESMDSLEQCARNGAMYCLRDRGVLAGVIAARLGAVRGIQAWYMVEEILGTTYQGRGLAPIMQRHFLLRLDRSSAPLVIGEIDDENVPSLRTALRVGRKDVGGWVFIGR
jgi:hypothetical protein